MRRFLIQVVLPMLFVVGGLFLAFFYDRGEAPPPVATAMQPVFDTFAITDITGAPDGTYINVTFLNKGERPLELSTRSSRFYERSTIPQLFVDGRLYPLSYFPEFVTVPTGSSGVTYRFGLKSPRPIHPGEDLRFRYPMLSIKVGSNMYDRDKIWVLTYLRRGTNAYCTVEEHAYRTGSNDGSAPTPAAPEQKAVSAPTETKTARHTSDEPSEEIFGM